MLSRCVPWGQDSDKGGEMKTNFTKWLHLPEHHSPQRAAWRQAMRRKTSRFLPLTPALVRGPHTSSFSSCGRTSAGTSLRRFLQRSYIWPSTVIADADPARTGSVYRSHLNAVSDAARRDEKPTVQAADCGKGWNKINAVNYLAKSSVVWLVESLGNWAADILGGLQMQLAHSHARSLTLYLHKSSPSVSASFFFFSSKSYLLTPAMDTADSASVISSLLHEKKKKKKRTQTNLDLRHGLQNIASTPGLQPELQEQTV